jgi:outer membrane protein assembly factor BamB
MKSDVENAPLAEAGEHVAASARELSRVWPAVLLVGLFWALELLLRWAPLPLFTGFLARVAVRALLLFLFVGWWLTNGRVARSERWLGLSAAVGGGALAALLSDKTVIAVSWLLMSLPSVLTSWAGWLVVSSRAPAPLRRFGLLVVVLLSWAPFTLMRMEGLGGDGQPAIHWRWGQTAEELFLAERAQSGWDATGGLLAGPSPTGPNLQPGDWPGFRGPNRDGQARGARIATDWQAAPPRLVWRQRVGPAWSSVAVVAGRLFTQEQRGQAEAVVCLDAATGRAVWAHEDAVRFAENLSGAGPRATPTFADGRIYALGATGILNCLDAGSGERKWSRDIAADSGAKPPRWGFSSSPLVVKGVVVVFAGGEGQKGLLAYRAETGELAWTAAAGRTSYSSPQLASFGREDQLLFLSDRGVMAVDPASGEALWEHAVQAGGPGVPRSLQPHPVGTSQVLIASEADIGLALLEVQRDGGTWVAARRWSSKALRPSFNDFVVHQGSIYGFDGGIFCCVDRGTGERRWKQGRYDHGQVLLLAEQGLLLVVSERGEVVLVAASPDRHEELGRFQAVKGKTWNHPALAHGRLYVRNAEEMACYELGLAPTP